MKLLKVESDLKILNSWGGNLKFILNYIIETIVNNQLKIKIDKTPPKEIKLQERAVMIWGSWENFQGDFLAHDN